MGTKLIQKRFLKGTREFEIIDNAIYVRIKSLFRKETSTLDLSTIDPEPVLNEPELEFHGRSRSGPVLSLLLYEPSTDQFNAFIDVLRQKILEQYSGYADNQSTSALEGLAGNVHEEPPELGDSGDTQQKPEFQPVHANRVEADIKMLKTYMKEDEIEPLLAALEVLKAEPDNESAFQQVVEAYSQLGFYQGAVLTYAPYLKVLMSNTLWQ